MSDPDHDWIDVDADPQFVGSGGDCTETEHQSGTDYFNTSFFPNDARYHIRLNQNAARASSGRFRTVGTPHYEVDTDQCGDVVPAHVPPGSDTAPSGFDYARGHIKNDWVAAYGSSKVLDVQNWRNQRRLEQCTTSLSNSNGRVYFLSTD